MDKPVPLLSIKTFTVRLFCSFNHKLPDYTRPAVKGRSWICLGRERRGSRLVPRS